MKPTIDELGKEIAKELRLAITDSVAYVQTAVNAKYSGPTSGTSLSSRSGNLRNSLTSKISGAYPKIEAKVFLQPQPIYASIHETGGKISGRPWLTIPFPGGPADTKSGLSATGRSARSFTNTFFFKSRAGNLILAQRQGKRKMVPLFVLKQSVNMPSRPVWETVRNETRPWVDARFEAAVQKSMSLVRA